MNFPKTKKEEVIEEMFGTKVADPYRWLENANSQEVQEWIDTQNAHTDQAIRDETFDTFSEELVKNFKVATFSSPVPVKGKYFYRERLPDEDQDAFFVKVGVNGNPIKLIDPNRMNVSNTVSLDFCASSRTGKYVAYGLSQGGNEMPTLYVKDVDTQENLIDVIPRTRNAQASWLPDDSGFFYNRHPAPGSVSNNEEHLHAKVYFHKLGDNYENDELVFGQGRPKDDMIQLRVSLDGRYLAICVSQKWTENDVFIYDCELKQISPLVVGISAQFALSFLKDSVVIRTNYKANNYRVLSASIKSMFTPIDEWQEIIPEKESILDALYPTKDKLLGEYIVNACSKFEMFNHSGESQGEIPLPPYSSLAGVSTRREEGEFFYGVTSFTLAKVIYRYLPDENKFSEYRKVDNPIDPDKFIVKQEWFPSKDGTKVPMFIFHRKDLDLNTPHPTILYGYGGFGNIETPGFMRSFVPWLANDGVFAVANIRGGGEFGDSWHKAGMKDKKQNTFDDFIACAEYLTNEGVTDSSRLGILGGSNGGLLVSAVAIQRPDLFAAVCSRVPLTDMVRFPLFGMALRWVHEYGDPKIEDELKNILRWSPYHNVKENTEYPAFLFTTAEKDTRVDPLHSRKMTAILQSVNKENNVLLFTEKEAGHGSGKPIKKLVESQALILTFFAQKLGLHI